LQGISLLKTFYSQLFIKIHFTMTKNYEKSLWLNLRTVGLVVLWLVMLGAWKPSNGQVSGTQTLPGTYASFAAFVTDINTNGIGAGGVTLNISAGYTETAPAGGFVITATGTAANPIIIQKSGVGTNPTFTAPAGGTATPASATQDGILAFVGSDFVTLNGLSFEDNNAANPASMEYAIAFFKASATDGCQNNTIQNCSITLPIVNNAAGGGPSVEGSKGIMFINATRTAAATALTITAASGSNSNNRIYSNTITGGNYGIVFVGFAATAGVGPAPDPATFLGDLNNDIGGNAVATGNIILNYGGAATATNPAAGIRVNNVWSTNISYNTIDNNNGSGVNHPNTLRGIFAQAGTSANVNITNNIINTRGGGTTQIAYAIENGVGATAATNNVNITNNSIGLAYATATTGLWGAVINTATATNVNINNNTIFGLAPIPGTGTVLLIDTGSPTNAFVNGNTIQNFERTTTAAGILRPIRILSPTNVTVNGNVINNLRYTGLASTGSIDGIYSFSSAVNENVTNNIISNLSTPTTGRIWAIYLFATAGNKVISGNEVFNLTTTTGGAGGADYIGIIASTGSNTIIRNKIYNISSAGTLGISTGIRLTGGTAPQIIANNVIGNLETPASTNTNAVRGIDITATSAVNVYYNTVYLNATSSSTTTFGTSCVSFSISPTSVDLRNNLLINLSTPAQAPANNADNGQTAALRRSTAGTAGVVPANYATTSNNNLFFVNSALGTNNYLMYVEGTGTGTVNRMNTLADMKAFMVNRDQLSVSENTTFASLVGSDANFLRPAAPTPATQAESGAVAITGVTDAYNGVGIRTGYPLTGQVNGGGFAPDIGAYEGDFGFIDGLPPTITYTPLGNTLSVANRPFGGVNITDPSNVNTTAGTRPRVYYKRSIDANTFVDNTNATNGWKFVEASNTSSPFNFTIDYSLLNGAVTPGTIIQYFVVAQDLAPTPNVGINSGTFATAPSSVNLVAANFPIGGTINQYAIAITYSGTINVGTSETITSLTNAGGLFEALNNGVLAGNLTVNITSDLTAETGAVALNTLVEEPVASNFTLTIRPSGGAARTVSGSINSNALIRFNSVSRVTIDGLNTGGNALTIANNATTSPSVINIGSVGTNPSTNITITNTTIINGSNTTSSAIFVGDATLGGAGYFNNITLSNNNVQRAFIGMFLNAVVTPGNGGSILVNNNTMNTSGTNAIRRVGIYLQGVNGGVVSNNTLANFEAATAEVDNAIWLATGTSNVSVTNNNISNLALTATSSSPIAINVTTGVASSNILISQNNISGITSAGTQVSTGIHVTGAIGGVTVSRNTITNIKNTNTDGWGASGIRLSSTLTSANIQVDNNSISDVGAAGFGNVTALDNGYGIIIDAGGGYRVYYNSVNMNANQTLAASLPAAFNVTSAVTTPNSIDVRNNVFVNSQTSGNTERYAIYSGAANTVYSNINFNNYFTTTGPNLGFLGSARSNLAAWQTATGQDANSVSVNPNFTSATNLLPTNIAFNNAGTPIAGITTDITGATRNATTPDMGAFEFDVTCPTVTFTPAAGALPAGTVGTAYSQTISQTGLTGTLTWSISAGTLPAGLSINSSTGVISGTPTATGLSNFTVQVTDGTCSATAAYSINVTCPTVTFTPAAGALPAGTVGTAYSQTISQTGLSSPTWSVSAGALPAGLSLNASTGEISGTPTATGTFNFTVQATSGVCSATVTYSITVSCAGTSISPATLPNGVVGTAYSQNLTVTGLSGTPTWSVSAGTLPTGLSLNTSTGQISGTPTATGAFSFTIQATDGVCTASQAYNVSVSCPTITFNNTTASNATVGVAYNLNASVSGNTQPITYSVSPALPAGLTLNTTTGIISGTPTATAPSTTYTVTASQSAGVCQVTQTYTFAVVCAGVSISPATLPNGIISTAYSQTLSVTGLSGTPTWSVSAGALPAGLSLNASTGEISGTPTALGSSTFTIQVTDGTCSASQVYTITISPLCPAITVNPATLPNGTVGVSYSQTITATGGTAPYSFAVTSGSLPAGLTLNASTGVISGVVTAATTASFTITATDASANACTGNRAYSINFTAISGPIIELTGDLDFGDVLVLQSAKRNLIIRNVGNAPLNVSDISLPPTVFSSNFLGSIAPGASQEVEVIFTPIATVAYSGNLVVVSNSVAGSNSIAVRGRGINPTAIGANTAIRIEAYPNPTQDKLLVKFENSYLGNYQITLTDMLGRSVRQSNAQISRSGQEVELNLQGLAEGMYLLQLDHTKGTTVLSVVKK
jgi:hypothetical protein